MGCRQGLGMPRGCLCESSAIRLIVDEQQTKCFSSGYFTGRLQENQSDCFEFAQVC